MSGQRILVIDDDLSIRRLLEGTLKRAGYDVIETTTATRALEYVKEASPDAILLDLGLPDRDGLEIVPLLRRATSAPILIISAREATEQKVAALDLGAHDYVTKPFDSEEVLARLRASLRDRITDQGGEALVHAGPVAIDLATREVRRDGAPVHLTRKEFDVLRELARYPGRVVTHRRIMAAAWPKDEDGRVEYLRIVVRSLRQKLEPDPTRPTLILNELGVGYRLIAGN